VGGIDQCELCVDNRAPVAALSAVELIPSRAISFDCINATRAGSSPDVVGLSEKP